MDVFSVLWIHSLQNWTKDLQSFIFLNLEKSKHGPEAGVCLFSWVPMEAVSKILLICLWAKYV